MTPLPLVHCPRCDREPPPGARFCPGCGTRLAPVGPARFDSPQAYTPLHLAEQIRTSRPALEGERKQVTVLFADVKGSMELLDDRDPEEADQLLGQVLERMMEAVHRYEGTVNQVLGDGVMALFGAPVAHEDHALRACYAALRMQEQIEAYGDVVQREHGVPLQIRVGLNSGEVVVRSIDTDLQIAYTAVGQTVHLAARMEQMAKPASILATAGTIALAGPRVVARPLGPVRVRGQQQPVEAYEVTGAARGVSRLGVSTARGLTPFVNREREMARLEAALERVRGGAGYVVAVVGEAGVGKSRLLHEFLRRCRAAGCLAMQGAALPYGPALAMPPGIDLLRRYFDVEDADDPGQVREKVVGRLTALDPGLEESIPPLLWWLGAIRPASPFLSLDVNTRRQRARRAVARLLGREGQAQPVVLAFEDLQWADVETRAALDELTLRLPARVLLLVTFRPEDDDGWHGRSGYERLLLEPLAPSPAEQLLEHLLGPGPTLGPLKHLLLERTGGSPLFLEEGVRALVDSGALDGPPGARRLARPVTTVDVPATVRAMLAARIDRLSPEEKRVLQVASVVGESVPVALVEAIADMPSELVERALARLVAAGFLEETSLFPEVAYAFRHALTHDVAYEGLLHERRRLLHARVMETIERLHAHRLDDQVERLAHHAFRGEVWDRAAEHLYRAGIRALGRATGREAVTLFEHALEALQHLPASRERDARAVDVRCELCNALTPLGEHGRMLGVLREAEALAEALGDERRQARVLSQRSTSLWELGDSDDAVAAGERALVIAGRVGDLDLEVVSAFSVAGARRALGDYPGAITLLRRNVERLLGEHEQATFGLAGIASVLSRGHMAWSLAELGEFEEAVRRAEEAIRTAEAAGHVYSQAHAQLGLGGALLRQGRLGVAITVLERGLALCQDVPFLFPPMAADLAVSYAASGRTGRAVDLAEQAVERAIQMGRLGRLALIQTHRGEVYLMAGRADEAREQGQRALDLAVAQKERGNEVYARRLLGLVAAEREPADVAAAREQYGTAMALAEALGMRPLLARCHLGLGRLARRLGEAEAAARHLRLASELFRAMEMTYWLERIELDRVGPPPHL